MYAKSYKGKIAAIIALDLHLHAVGYKRTAVYNKVIRHYAAISRRYFFKIIDPKISVSRLKKIESLIEEVPNLTTKEKQVANDLANFYLEVSKKVLTNKDLT